MVFVLICCILFTNHFLFLSQTVHADITLTLFIEYQDGLKI